MTVNIGLFILCAYALVKMTPWFAFRDSWSNILLKLLWACSLAMCTTSCLISDERRSVEWETGGGYSGLMWDLRKGCLSRYFIPSVQGSRLPIGLHVRLPHTLLFRDIVLCSWARHLTLTVPLSTLVYKWVPVNSFFWGEGSPAMC